MLMMLLGIAGFLADAHDARRLSGPGALLADAHDAHKYWGCGQGAS